MPAHLHSRAMLYFTCRGGEYFAGYEDGTTRHAMRRPEPDTPPPAA